MGTLNRILFTKLRRHIIIPLNDIVEWDRYGIRDNESGFVFGWIKREGEFYDFLLVEFKLIRTELFATYNTSSSKYSKEIGYRLKCQDETYIECRSARDMPEANVVSWQKTGLTTSGLEFINRILWTKLRRHIIIPLNDIVEWDRYGIRDNESGFVFGWIKREDEFYDFLLVEFSLILIDFVATYNTSSSKYSKEIGHRLRCSDQNYVECRSAREMPEANVVRWQKDGPTIADIEIHENKSTDSHL